MIVILLRRMRELKLRSKENNEIDFEKKNLERIQKMQERKNQELALMEEERRKAQEGREKLKKIVIILEKIRTLNFESYNWNI